MNLRTDPRRAQALGFWIVGLCLLVLMCCMAKAQDTKKPSQKRQAAPTAKPVDQPAPTTPPPTAAPATPPAAAATPVPKDGQLELYKAQQDLGQASLQNQRLQILGREAQNKIDAGEAAKLELNHLNENFQASLTALNNAQAVLDAKKLEVTKAAGQDPAKVDVDLGTMTFKAKPAPPAEVKK